MKTILAFIVVLAAGQTFAKDRWSQTPSVELVKQTEEKIVFKYDSVSIYPASPLQMVYACGKKIQEVITCKSAPDESLRAEVEFKIIHTGCRKKEQLSVSHNLPKKRTLRLDELCTEGIPSKVFVNGEELL